VSLLTSVQLATMRPTPPVNIGDRVWPAPVMNAYITERNNLLETCRHLFDKLDEALAALERVEAEHLEPGWPA